MGDVVLTTPIIRMLKRQINADVSFLTKWEYADVFKDNPYIKKIYFWSNLSSKSIVRDLQSQQFDYLIDLHNSLRSRRILLQLQGKKLALNKRIRAKFLLHYLGINKYDGTHIVYDYLDTAKSLGIQDDGAGLDFFISDSGNAKDENPMKPSIAISAGGTHVTKRIRPSLINSIISYTDYNYRILGGNDVEQEVQELQAAHVINDIGNLTLQESAMKIAQCDLLITGDTGMMHIAAALQKPIIVIWGSTAEEVGFYPHYGSQSKQRFISIRNSKLTCQPCSKYGRTKCPKDHMNCMNQITIHEVRGAIRKLLR